MWAWFLSPIGRKFLIGGILLIVIGFAFRMATNRAWEQGFDKGKVDGVEALTKAKEKEWKEKDAAIAQEKADLATAAAALEEERALVSQSRATIVGDRKKALETIREAVRGISPEIAKIPASELDESIRKALARVR